MKLFELLMDRILERRVRKYGKGCARAMLISFLAMKEHYKEEAPTYAWLARQALNTRPHWKQTSQITFVYDLGPSIDQPIDLDKYRETPWLTGTLDITDGMSLWDVVQGVMQTELYWHYLRSIAIWKRFEFMDFALKEAAKYLKAG